MLIFFDIINPTNLADLTKDFRENSNVGQTRLIKQVDVLSMEGKPRE